MKNIRCAFVASFYGPYYSSFVAAMVSFDKMMQGKGQDVIYILPKETQNFDWIKVFQKQNNKIYFINYKPYSFNNLKSLRKIFKAEKINLIYSHMCGWDITAHFAAPFTPIIWHMRMGVDNVNPKKKIKNWIKFNILGFGKTYHIAVSQPVTDAINSFKPHNKCVTIQNALDLSRLIPKSDNINKEYKEVLLFGWEPRVKGLDITLDACQKLIEQGKNFKLLVSAQEKTYEYIKNQYDVSPEWLELLEPTSDVSSLYSRADIMVSASRSEGFSFSLAEAIYSGCVTVVSDIPGTSWSSEFNARYEFESGNADALKTALENALNHQITKQEQDTNRQILEQKYSMDVWSKSVYNELKSIFSKEK